MVEIDIRSLKQNAYVVVADVMAGKEVTITLRGRPVVRMTATAVSRLDELVSSGRVAAAGGARALRGVGGHAGRGTVLTVACW